MHKQQLGETSTTDINNKSVKLSYILILSNVKGLRI